MSDNPFETDYDVRNDHPNPENQEPATPRHVLQGANGGWLEPATEAVADNAQVHVHVSAPSTNDAELDAMQLCLQACEGLNNGAKVRVCTWLTERLGAWRSVMPSGYPMPAPAPLPSSPFGTP